MSPTTEVRSTSAARPELTAKLKATGGSPQGPKKASSLASKIPPGLKVKASTAIRSSVSSKLTTAESTTQPAGNVFAGGAVQKKRKSLQDVSSDSSKGPKFLSHRYNRLLEKGSKDKENNAPVQMPKKLISLDPKAPQTLTSTSSVNPQLEKPQKQDDISGEVTDIDAGQPAPPRKGSLKRTPTGGGTGTAEASQAHTRRKSVRWDDNVQITSFEPVEVLGPEPSLFVPDDDQAWSLTAEDDDEVEGTRTLPRNAFPKWRSPSPPRGQERHYNSTPSVVRQNISKPCLLGSQASRAINLVFQDVPQNVPQPWVADFRGRDRLVFSHTCTAQDFRQQFRRDPNLYRNLACGSLSAPTDRGTLETVAARLKLRSQGVFCYASCFCVLLFPYKSEEWQFEAEHIRRTSGSLLYIVFEPMSLTETDLALSGSLTSAERESWEKTLPRILRQFTNLEYQRVFPSTLQNPEKHHIFLAFPSTTEEEARLLVSWLKVSSNTECIIYDGYTAGDWARFVNVGKGAMIIHEDAMWKIRQFPGMFDVLNQASSGSFAISIFQRACGGFPAAATRSAADPGVGEIGLWRLFLSPKVFLMTPSFIASQPQEVRLFVNFFLKARDDNEGAFHRARLAVPANLEEWLLDLLADRVKKPVEKSPNIHKEDIKALAKVIHHIGLLVEGSSEDEVLSSLIIAPATIDASDEQSLVNWFGWWTITNLDRYGRFYVLGSAGDSSPLWISPSGRCVT